MSPADRASMAMQTAEAMQTAYEAEGEEGDFADAERYLRDDASDVELQAEFDKWTSRKHTMTIITHPAGIAAFALTSQKHQLKLERLGTRSSGGALRPRLAASLGLKPRDSYDAYIAAIDAKLADLGYPQ